MVDKSMRRFCLADIGISQHSSAHGNIEAPLVASRTMAVRPMAIAGEKLYCLIKALCTLRSFSIAAGYSAELLIADFMPTMAV